MDRKQQIIEEIKKSNKPISATKLANIFGVSRQVIVGDIALIRATGTNVIATPRGYVLDSKIEKNQYTIAVKHDKTQLQEELYTIVDLGGFVVDVIVEHSIYGQLIGTLHLQSRFDVEEFLKKIDENDALLLSQLTEGIHLHTIQCQSKEIFNRIIVSLKEKEILL